MRNQPDYLHPNPPVKTKYFRSVERIVSSFLNVDPFDEGGDM